MPQYHGPASYVVEVLEHLLRHYIVWMFVYAVVLPTPFAIWGALRVGFEEGVLPWLHLTVGKPIWWLSVSHWAMFCSFPFYASARFPYASPYLTFAIAGLAGSALLAAVWTLFDGAWIEGTFLHLLLWAGAGTVAAGAFGAGLMKLGGTGSLHFGLGRWIGWLVVGRAAFEAFLATDAARLKREFETFAKLRRS